MQKKQKLFVQKQPLTKTRKRSYLSLFLWAALGLVLLVIVTTFATRQKATDRESKKPVAEKGILVREVPRPEGPAREIFPQGPGVGGEGQPARDGAGTVASVPDFKSFPGPQETGGSGASDVKSAVTDASKTVAEPGAPPPVAVPAGKAVPKAGANAPGNLSGSAKKGQIPAKEKATAEGTRAIATDTKERDFLAPADPETAPHPGFTDAAPASSGAGTPPEKPAKPSAQTSSKLMYVVQLGSFKDKQNAEEMRQNLAKRGYEVVIREHNHAKLGQLFVVQLQPMAEEGKANTLMTQISHEAKVKPVMLKVPGEQ